MSPKNRLTPLGKLLDGALPEHVARRLPPRDLARAWARSVGEFLASKTKPLSLTPQGELVASVAGAALRQELLLMTPMILEDLRAQGFDLHGIKLVSQRQAPPPLPPEPPLPELSPEEEESLAREVESVHDPELRQSLASFRRAMLRSRKAEDR